MIKLSHLNGVFWRDTITISNTSFHLINQNTAVSTWMILLSVYYYEIHFIRPPKVYRQKPGKDMDWKHFPLVVSRGSGERLMALLLAMHWQVDTLSQATGATWALLVQTRQCVYWLRTLTSQFLPYQVHLHPEQQGPVNRNPWVLWDIRESLLNCRKINLSLAQCSHLFKNKDFRRHLSHFWYHSVTKE